MAVEDGPRYRDGHRLPPDGKALATSSMGGTIKIRDTATGELRLNLETPAANTLQFTRDCGALISVDQAGTVKCWRAVLK